MTRAHMPGRGTPLHLVDPPRCWGAEAMSDDERALLGQLVWHAEPPKLRLVPRSAEPARRATPAADLRRARLRQMVDDWTAHVAVLAAAAAAVIALLGRLDGLVP